MQTERRQSSPEYRERVHKEAERRIQDHGHDYDDAANTAWDEAIWAASHPQEDDAELLADVTSLLRRRAETVKGMRVP